MAPLDDDKVMAGMLRRTFASSSTSEGPVPGNDCPPAGLLAAYYEHSLGEDESARYDLHFSQCARCREQLAAMVRAEKPPQPKTNWAWLWSPYLLAPAVAALALAVFFGMHHSARTTAVDQPPAAPLVAMSQQSQPPSQDTESPKPAAPITANGNANLGQPQAAPLVSNELDSLSKTKQSPLPTPPSASQNATVSVTPATAPSATLATPEPAEPPNTHSDKKARDLPLNGRNVVKLQPLAPPANASSAGAVQGVAAPRTVTQSVEVNAAGPSAQAQQSAAPAPPAAARAVTAGPIVSATPAPPTDSDSVSLGGLLTTAPPPAADKSATAETVNRGQKQAPAAMGRYAMAANALSPGVAAGIAAQRIFQTPNTRVLWRPAAGGFVERSADGGATWQGQSLPGISGEIDAGSSPTLKICWLVGSGGTIFMTKDAVNWKKIAPPVPADFSAVTAQDASNATVTTADGRQFQTADGGKHWKAIK